MYDDDENFGPVHKALEISKNLTLEQKADIQLGIEYMIQYAKIYGLEYEVCNSFVESYDSAESIDIQVHNALYEWDI